MDNDNLIPTGDQTTEAHELQSIGDWEAYTNAVRDHMTKIREATAKTPPKHVHERPGPGGPVKYVTDEYLRGLLDEHFPDWSFMVMDREIVGMPTLPKPVAWVHGRLILTMPAPEGTAGRQRVFDDLGEHPVEFTGGRASDDGKGQKPQMLAPVAGALKAAHTDAFKRCIRLALNAAHDVYRPKEEERNLSPEDIEKAKGHIVRLERIMPDLSATDRLKAEQMHNALVEAMKKPSLADKQVVTRITINASKLKRQENGTT